MKKTLKVLFIAYACEPNKGSEPGVGWSWAQTFKDDVELHLITRSNNERAILDAPDHVGITFHYYDLPIFIIRLKKYIGVQVYHFLWQLFVTIRVYFLHKKNEFDIVQLLTFGVSWGGSLCGVFHRRFVWGPIGGGDVAPKVCRAEWGLMSRLRESIRGFAIKLMFELNPFILINIHTAKLILARTPDTFKLLANRNKKIKCILQTETFFQHDPVENNEETIKERIELLQNNSLRLISVGRLMPLKQTEIALATLNKLVNMGVDANLTIIGKGPEELRLRKKVFQQGLNDRVTFVGKVGRTKVFDHLEKSHFLLHFSAREGGSWSVHEACISGLPVIGLNNSGVGMIVTEGLGLVLPPDKLDLTSDLASHYIIKYIRSPMEWSEMVLSMPNIYKQENDLELHRGRIMQMWQELI